jgi:Polyketide cyclase / dehydrase and lipid transport
VSSYLVSEQRVIAAERQRIFDIVADPAMHPVMDGSGSVRAIRPGGPQRLALDAKFGMDMKLGAPYKIVNTVVEFDEGHRIAWRHFNGHIWRYTFEPVDGGTLVTEQWDARRTKNRILLRLMGFPARNRRGIQNTLQQLDELATSTPE